MRVQGQPLEYTLVRSARRTIGLRVGAAGLEVRAPLRLGQAAVDAVLQAKGGWIARKLQDWAKRPAAESAPELSWRPGSSVPYLGSPLQLDWVRVDSPARLGLAQRVAQARWLANAANEGRWPQLQPVPLPLPWPLLPQLQLPFVAEPDGATWAKTVAAWWFSQARAVFTQRLNHWAPQMGVQWADLGLGTADHRWGSARRGGHIRLNVRLLHGPLEWLDYVVVHELAHLKEMNHSPRFWAVVAQAMPQAPALRRALHQAQLPRWNLGAQPR